MQSQTTIEQLEKQVAHLMRERDAYRASAEEYRAVLDASMDAVFHTVPDGRILHANRAACDLFQMTEAELVAGGRACLYADNDETLVRALDERRKTGSFHGVLNHRRKDGTVFPGEVSSVVFTGANGEERTCTIIRDRSTELQAARELEEAIQKYKTLFETFPLGITISDADGNIIETNASAEKLLGLDREEHETRSLAGRQWQIIRPDGTPMPSEEWASVIALKERRRVENCVLGVIRSDEKVIWLNVAATPLPLVGAGVIVTYADITDKQSYEECLTKYKNIVSSTQDGVAFLDVEYRYQIVNEAYAGFTGVKQETLVGLSVAEYLGEDVFQEVIRPQFDRCLQGETINFQQWFDYPSLGRKFFDVTYTPYRDATHRIAGVVATIRDNTAQRLVEETLQRSEEQFRTLASLAPVGIYLTSSRGDCRYVNPAWCAMAGMSPEEASGDGWVTGLHPDDRSRVVAAWQEMVAKDHPWGLEYRFMTPEGKVSWVYGTARPQRDASGAIQAYIGVNVDITERKMAEQALRESETKYRELFDSSTDGIIRTDLDGVIQDVNLAFLRMVGYADIDELKKTYQDLTPARWHDYERDIVANQIMGRGYADEYEKEYIHKNGTVFPIGIKVWLVRDGGKPIGMWGIVRDITAQKQQEQQRRRLEEQLASAMAIASLGYWEYDVAADLFTFNNQFYRVFRTAFEQVGRYKLSPAEYAERFVHPEDRHLVGEEVCKCIETTSPEFHGQLEHRMIFGDGRFGYVSVKYFIEKDGEGKTVKIYGVYQDITDRKTAEMSLVESEQRWKNILVHVPQIGISLDPEARVVFANAFFLQLTGWTEGEVVGRNWFDLCIPEEVREEVRQVFRMVIQQEDTLGFSTYENVIMDRSGTLLDVAWSNVLTRDLDGKILEVTCLGVDITERKRAERQLQESEEKYRTILTSAMDGFWLTDTRGRILEVNDTYCAMTGYSRAELLSMGIGDVEVNEDDAQITERMQMVVLKWSDRFESRHRRKDGTVFDVEVSVQYRPERGGRCICFLRDITERKEGIEALRHASTKMRLAADSAHLGIWDYNVPEGRLEWDDWMFRIYGLDRSSFTGAYEAWQACLHPEDRERATGEVAEALRSATDFDTEFRIVRPDGTVRYIKANATVSCDAQGVPLRMTGINADITDRKTTVLALQESEERFKALHNASFGGITIHDKGIILECNKGLSDMTGYEYDELIGMNGLYLISDNTRDQVIQNIEAGYEKPYEVSGVRKNGEIYPLRLEARGIPYKGKNVRVVEFRDISELKRIEAGNAELEAKLHQAQKMEAVGRLAGGVAHDFNNMLGVIIGNAEEGLEDLSPDNPLYMYLDEIKGAGERSADLVKQLLAFARRQTVSPKVIDLNQTIGGITRMLHRIIGEDLDLEWLPGEHIWPIKIDPNQIDQILANLCVNARDAIVDVGKITIETGNATFDADSFSEQHGLLPGDYVVLAVRDNGCGMDISIVKNIFEPFFTTKETGKGTGLGLATVYGVVKQNNGYIDVDSEPGKGTTFRIYFPRYLTRADVTAGMVDTDRVEPGHETILLVEDELAILAMTKRILERLGYHVIPASTPGEAIRLAREHSGKIDLLIADVIMPEMNGRDLARNILTFYPGLKRLFMSGYTANVIAHHGVLDDGVNFIEKPFSKGELGRKVRTILDSD